VLSGLNTDNVREMFADDFSKTTFYELIKAYKSGSFDFSHVNAHEPMYFNDIFKDSITPDEVFLSVGVLNVSTIVSFVLYTKGKYNKIYAFEPDVLIYKTLDRELSDFRDFEMFPFGLSDRDAKMFFDTTGVGFSKIVDDIGDHRGILTEIEVKKYDDFAQCSLPPTLIKMDIEGAEYEALIGAEETIRKYKPKLAISAYHLDDDLVRLPLLIREMVPEYKLYLRHHTDNYGETVIYAKV
jgi:FkbM family methyltransferase